MNDGPGPAGTVIGSCRLVGEGAVGDGVTELQAIPRKMLINAIAVLM